MNKKTLLMLLIMTLSLMGCNSIKVTSEHARGYNFKTAKTYAWQDAEKEILDQFDTYLNPEIPKAIDAELSFKGMSQVADQMAADLLLSYYVKVTEETGYTSGSDHDENREFSGGFVFSHDSKISYQERESDLNVYGWEIGTLTLIMHDAKTGERVWLGEAKTEMNRAKPKEDQQKLIQKVAEKLMNPYPPIQ